MEIGFKRILLLGLGSLIYFLTFNSVFGATIYQQASSTDEFSISGTGGYTYQKLGNGLTGDITEVCVYGKSSSQEIRISLIDDTDNNFSNGYNSVLFNRLINDFPTSSSEYCFNQAFSLESDKFYYLYLYYYHYGNGFYINGSNDVNAWVNTTYDYFTEIENDWNKDIYFKFNDGSVSSTLALSYPSNLQTTTDFTNFIMPYTNLSTSTFEGIFYGVCYGLDQEKVGNCNINSYEETQPSFPYKPIIWIENFGRQGTNFMNSLSANGILQLFKPRMLLADNYFAKAYLYGINSDGSYSLIANSPEIAFEVIGGDLVFTGSTTQAIANYYGTASSSINLGSSTQSLVNDSWFFVDCSAYDDVPFFSSSTIGMLGCQMEKTFMRILGFLFVPSISMTDFVQDNFEDMSRNFPFNIFFGTLRTLKGELVIQSQNNNSQEMVLTLSGGDELEFNMNLIDPNILDGVMSSSTKAQIFESITYMSHLGLIVLMFLVIL